MGWLCSVAVLHIYGQPAWIVCGMLGAFALGVAVTAGYRLHELKGEQRQLRRARLEVRRAPAHPENDLALRHALAKQLGTRASDPMIADLIRRGEISA